MVGIAGRVAAMSGGLYVAAFAPFLHVNKTIIWQQRTLSEVFFPKLRSRNISADVSPLKHLDRDFRLELTIASQLDLGTLEEQVRIPTHIRSI